MSRFSRKTKKQSYSIELTDRQVYAMGYDPKQLDRFVNELCRSLAKLTDYDAEYLRDCMDEYMEDAEDEWGNPISGISDCMLVALELDF